MFVVSVVAPVAFCSDDSYPQTSAVSAANLRAEVAGILRVCFRARLLPCVDTFFAVWMTRFSRAFFRGWMGVWMISFVSIA